MAVQPRLVLSDTQQTIIDFFGLLLINLSVIVIPADAPKWIGGIFVIFGFVAILVRAELPTQNPSKFSMQQVTFFLSVASTLTAINGYIALTYPDFWWGGLIIGILGAAILAIKQQFEGAPVPAHN